MGKKNRRIKSKRKTRINLFVILFTLLLAVFVLAVAPTTPTSMTPSNESAFFNDSITASGSTDGDGDSFNYLLWYYWNDTKSILLQNESSLSFELRGFGNLDKWETQCTEGQTCEFREGSSRETPYELTSRSGGSTSLNFTTSYLFNMDELPIYVWGDTNPKTIYIDGNSEWTSSSSISANYLEFIDVSAYNDGSTHDLIFNFEPTAPNQQMFFWFEHHNGTFLTQTQDENNDYSGNLTYSYTLPVFKPCNESLSNKGLTISFENENNTGTKINGTINNLQSTLKLDSNDDGLIFQYQDTNSDENHFCINPTDEDINFDSSITYSGSGFPQRTVVFNQSLNGSYEFPLTLFLLPTSDGLYVTFQIIDVGGTPIQDVYVTASKVLGSSLTTISSGYTDSSGGVTFWLDPNSQHTITASKTGYESTSESITPSQSSYTIILGGETTNYTSPLWGISYNILPVDIILNNHTDYNFTFEINSTYWDLSSYGFSLYNSTNDLLATQSDNNVSGGILYSEVNTYNNSQFYMNYWWNIDGNYTNFTRTWDIRYTYTGDLSIKNFFTDLKNYADVGFNAGFDGFGFAILSIIIIVGMTIWLSYQFGIYSPQGIGFVVVGLVYILEYLEIIPALAGKRYLISAFVFLMWLAYIIQEESR
jgi:hypothetical protein